MNVPCKLLFWWFVIIFKTKFAVEEHLNLILKSPNDPLGIMSFEDESSNATFADKRVLENNEKIDAGMSEIWNILSKSQVKELNSGKEGRAINTILRFEITSFPDEAAKPRVEPGYPSPKLTKNSPTSSVSRSKVSSEFKGSSRSMLIVAELKLIGPENR